MQYYLIHTFALEIIEQLWHDMSPDVKDCPEGFDSSARAHLLYGVAWGQVCCSHVV